MHINFAYRLKIMAHNIVDIKIFIEACLQAREHAYSSCDFYQKIRNLQVDDYRLYFLKAACEYHQFLVNGDRTIDDFITANIDNAVKLMESKIILSYDSVFGQLNDVRILNAILEPSVFCKALNVPKQQVYQLAAEIYSIIEQSDNKAIEYYKKMLFESFRIKPHKDIINKDSVTLYSFRRINEYTLNALRNNEITFSNASCMNDPFDSLANVLNTLYALDQRCKHKKHIKSQNEAFKYFRIRSFSANRITYNEDDSLLSNMLMWSHYTDSHKGICIKYVLSSNFCELRNEETGNFRHLFPVIYTEEPITIYEPITTKKAFALKSKCWEYENEVRLVSFNKDINDAYSNETLDNKSFIKEVIFGIRCTKENRDLIKKVLSNNNNVCFSKMMMDNEDIYTLKKVSD